MILASGSSQTHSRFSYLTVTIKLLLRLRDIDLFFFFFLAQTSNIHLKELFDILGNALIGFLVKSETRRYHSNIC